MADLENRQAVIKLYEVKKMSQKKPLSLLCRSLADIAHYTTGFPVNNEAGSKDWFSTVKKVLPGPYTLILPASKNLPRQIIERMKDKTVTQHRRSVGVRISDDPVCQSILESLGTPLLCTSVNAVQLDRATESHEPDQGGSMDYKPKKKAKGGQGGGSGPGAGSDLNRSGESWVPDLGSMLESFPLVDFIVHVGPRVVQVSTVVDMTGNAPEVVRIGRGDPSYFEE